MAGVLARSVTSWSSWVDHGTAWSFAQPPTLASSLDEVAARAHEVRERPDGDAADHRDREGERERETRGRPRVEPAAQQAREPRMPNGLLRELLSCGSCCRRRRPGGRRVVTGQEIDGDAGRESEEEEDDEGHGARRFVYPTLTRGKRGEWQSTLPIWKQPARPSEPTSARDRGSPGRLVGAAARAHPRRARQSDSPARSAAGHPVRVFLAAILSGYAILLALTIAVGFLLTRCS